MNRLVYLLILVLFIVSCTGGSEDTMNTEGDNSEVSNDAVIDEETHL